MKVVAIHLGHDAADTNIILAARFHPHLDSATRADGIIVDFSLTALLGIEFGLTLSLDPALALFGLACSQLRTSSCVGLFPLLLALCFLSTLPGLD